ncbi:MAG: sensor histidine kinase [Rhodobacteraceae bacterium]|nr:sensor histidine kinase [Paracoccaceae bacterium]
MSEQSTARGLSPPDIPAPGLSWAARALIVGLVVAAAGVMWLTNAALTERFTQTTLARAELRLTLYSGNIVAEVERNAVVPLLLSRDTVLIEALEREEFATTSQRLMSYETEMAVNSILLLDMDGRTVAATDRTALGASHRNKLHFVDALRAEGTVFTVSEAETGGFEFAYSRRIVRDRRALGVIVVRVDLARLEQMWRASGEQVMVADADGRIILGSEPRWRGRQLSDISGAMSDGGVIERALATRGGRNGESEAFLTSAATLRVEGRLPVQGWRLVYLTSSAPVRDRVNGVLALELMVMALLLAFTFYQLSRRARSQSLAFQRESMELRRLNARLQREIAQRERVERNLEVAEQSLAQSSKLAALGEMAAAISHELNQPLAAMRTYLAGARLLLHRKRPEEAMSSFQRIDDLIERMSAITRQLKSYARKGVRDLGPVDMREAVASALSMMTPQLNHVRIQISQTLPQEPVMVQGDALRLEQVIVNLLRNALDATRGQNERMLDILLTGGETGVVLAVRDNGPGIEDLDQIFEPFYTTKQPGDGVGLGLAISSGIIKDLGGRLTGRNGEGGGAVFEVHLPALPPSARAAE